MLKHNELPIDPFERQVHIESHRRMSGDERPFSELSPIGKITRTALIETVDLPDVAHQIRDELTIFQSQLDVEGLTDQ